MCGLLKGSCIAGSPVSTGDGPKLEPWSFGITLQAAPQGRVSHILSHFYCLYNLREGGAFCKSQGLPETSELFAS